MKHLPPHPEFITQPSLPKGVTLSEVLVSVVIMSVGVVLLSTLLPISILRTAQATQLTQAVFLRNNAEAAIEANPTILNNFQIPITGATIGTTNLAVVDPVGLATGLSASLSGLGAVPRISGTTTSGIVSAEGLAMLPDSWTLVCNLPVSSFNSTGITVPNTSSVIGQISGILPRNTSNSATGTASRYRMILFGTGLQSAAVRDLYQISTSSPWTLSWQDPSFTEAALPPSFTPTSVRIEVQARRFTWLMTVAKKWVPIGQSNDFSWAAEINVAVFFNRSFNLNDETQFAITQVTNGFDQAPGVAGVDDDGLNGVDDAAETGWIGSDDNRTVTVTGSPFLKKGSYMLEPTQLKWYRIVNFNPDIGAVLFDQDLRSLPNSPQGIFMKGIIEVYSLGVRTGTSSFASQ